jgi:hypothetical protein
MDCRRNGSAEAMLEGLEGIQRRNMSDSQIRQASIATLLARVHTLSISSNDEDRAEAAAIQREISIRLVGGDS